MSDAIKNVLHSTREHVFTSRGLSIVAALILDVTLVWLLFFQKRYYPEFGAAEIFWLSAFIGLFFYSVLQLWTLAVSTSRETDFLASFDKFIALTPLIVGALVQIYWVGQDGYLALSWRHHVVTVVFAIFSLVDYFSTDIINQRLRARQIGLGQQSVG